MKNNLPKSNDGEFLWLVSLSDLMILLFVFFVVLFSFTYQKLSPSAIESISSKISGDKNSTLDQIQAQLLKWVVDKNLLENINIEQKEDSLIIQIKEGLLFGSGQANLKDNSQPWIAAVGDILKKVPSPYRIGIEGHTDDTPAGASFGDNWNLSGLRAVSVLRGLELSGEALQRTVVMGYGDVKPLLPNRDEKGVPIQENQAKNRRVTIRIF